MPCPTRRDIMLLSAALLSYQASYPKVSLIRLRFPPYIPGYMIDPLYILYACRKLGGA